MLNREEQRLVDAAKGTPVHMASNSEFAKSLTRFAAGVGANEVPTNETVMIIREMVVEYENWITIPDIKVASELNTAKRLPAESEAYAKSENEPVDQIQIFGKITPPKFFSIMKRYKTVRGLAVTKSRQESEVLPASKQLTGVAPTVTEDEWLALHKKNIEFYKSGKDTWTFGSANVLKWLYDSGKMSDDYFTETEWKYMKQNAKMNIMDREVIGPGKLDRMESWQKTNFNNQCLVELKTVVYGAYIKKWLQKETNGTH
jgi:hypothetical protein